MRCSVSCPVIAQQTRYEFHSPKMGTEFNMIVYGHDSIKVAGAVALAWQRIDRINEVFSDYSSSSELHRIHENAREGYYPMSGEFEKVLRLSLVYSRLSKGAFDVSVGSLSRLWRRAIKMDDFPEAGKIEEARKAAGYRKIKFKDSGIRIPANLFLDFGAIAKGYAVDEAYKVLVENQLPIALVDGGGDVYAGLAPPGTEGWVVSLLVSKPDGRVEDSTVLVVSKAIVTSGDAYKYIERDGKRYSHIIDPRTGYGVAGPQWATVIAASATHADALATVMCLLSGKAALKFEKKWKRRFGDQGEYRVLVSKLAS